MTRFVTTFAQRRPYLAAANTGAFIMRNPLHQIAAGRFVRAAACAALGIAAAAPGSAQAASERVLHAFGVSPHDGVYPYNRLAKIGRDLYSTTYSGGSYGGGTVFKIAPDGTERVIHSFGAANDGKQLVAALVELNGMWYGTTRIGGTAGQGTVFSITPQGTETVLYSFQGGKDGSDPELDLVPLNGVLYGAARAGGVNGNGTVYSITPSGSFTTLHHFKGGVSDGANPAAPLTVLNGQLYGDTLYGGSNNAGTFFTISIAGTESVLHSFGSGQDGSVPFKGLLLLGARFYGTTEYGGTGGQGTVYSVTPAGREHVVYSFPANGSTGALPLSAPTAVHGVLYGTTGLGGGTGCGGSGCGTVYSLTKDGTETVLYAFQGGNDGNTPTGTPLYEKGVFYGTTAYGGNTDCGGQGCGTVFSVTP